MSTEYLPLGILIASLCLPFAIFAAINALGWREPYASLTCITLVVVQCAVFRIRDIDDKSIDTQILAKLACLSLMGTMIISAWWNRPWPAISGQILLSAGAFLLLAVIGCSIAVNPLEATVETCANALVFIFLVTILSQMGAGHLRHILLMACAALSILSLIAFVADPELARMTDWSGDSYVVTNRLQGVFGTPNAAGASAAFCLLVLTVYWRRDEERWRQSMLIVLFGIVLLASNNRMAIGAVVFVLSVLFLIRSRTSHVATIALCGLTMLALTTLLFGADLAVLLSRSGTLTEVTSGSGRMQIWSVVLDLWSQRPFFGYGIASGKFILPHHPLLFGAAAHAHSLYLNALFAGGLVGFGALVACLVTTALRAWRGRAAEVFVLLSFFLLYGITEPIIGGLPSFVSICFVTTLLIASVTTPQPNPAPTPPEPAPVIRSAKMGSTR